MTVLPHRGKTNVNSGSKSSSRSSRLETRARTSARRKLERWVAPERSEEGGWEQTFRVKTGLDSSVRSSVPRHVVSPFQSATPVWAYQFFLRPVGTKS